MMGAVILKASPGVDPGSTLSFLDLRAQSSRVSAASYFPCLLYKAPRFFRVVVKVDASVFAALCHAPYSPKGALAMFDSGLFLFSSLSSATCQMGLFLSSITPNSRSWTLKMG
jgi:hypothetical protein